MLPLASSLSIDQALSKSLMEACWVDRGLVVGTEERSKTMRNIWKDNGELMEMNR